MRIRKANHNDLAAVLAIINYGRGLQNQFGSDVAWPDFYPDASHILEDIHAGHSYLCVSDEAESPELALDTPLATICLQEGLDPTYATIEGAWLNDSPYTTIHRIASNQRWPGAGRYCMQYAVTHHPNLRIDTHKDNLAMLNLIQAFAFTYCGIVEVRPGEYRRAFQLVQ